MDQHDEDVWHVQMESGEVRILTLDQLDAFFQNGIIDEETYILRDGTMDWRTLRDVLGLGEAEPEAPAPQVVPQVAAASPLSPTPAPVSYGAVPSFQPSFQPSFEQRLSTRPVVSEIDPGELDELEASFKKKGKAGKYIVAVGAIGAVAAMIGIVGANRIGSFSSHANVSAAVVNVVPVQTTPPVVTPPPDPTVAAALAQPKLNDDVKKALADKDTQLTQKIDARKQARKAAPPPLAHKSSSQPFHKGGNAYDPLNAKL